MRGIVKVENRTQLVEALVEDSKRWERKEDSGLFGVGDTLPLRRADFVEHAKRDYTNFPIRGLPEFRFRKTASGIWSVVAN